MPEQVIQPRIRGFIATNAHPGGCRQNTLSQIATTQARGVTDAGLNVLVVGASTGYGFSSRVAAAFGFNAKTLGVFFERPADGDRTASAGYYNSVAFHEAASKVGLYAKSINGDGFSDAVKAETLDTIQRDMGKIDVLVYSLAAPRRTHPKTGIVHSSVLKPLDEAYSSKTIDLSTGEVTVATMDPATGAEVADTIQVMGGEDFAIWVDALLQADLFAENARAVTYSYIGPALTHAIYYNGTIGQAKQHMEATTRHLDKRLQEAVGGNAYLSVNKAVVTQASAAIPVVPLYLSMLYPVMREAGTHEAPIDQMNRLFREHLAPGMTPTLDDEHRIRLDNLELTPPITNEINRRWEKIETANLSEYADFAGFRSEFRQLFGFEVEGVDYTKPTETDLPLK
ncbi:MAG: trans-2-enoyl-CoA reductase family protein [Candidatus Poribacteria bacterium]|nr:trans-2-enoyl-CoA reductase family protein [Candidatus Poribacteria bacterium]